jgi:hypothetical protein
MGRFRPERWPGCSILVAGDPRFRETALALAAADGIPATVPYAGGLARLFGHRAFLVEQARKAARESDFLISFWDGVSVDWTQHAAQVALDAGKVFEVYGPDGTVVRAGNQGKETRAPTGPQHGWWTTSAQEPVRNPVGGEVPASRFAFGLLVLVDLLIVALVVAQFVTSEAAVRVAMIAAAIIGVVGMTLAVRGLPQGPARKRRYFIACTGMAPLVLAPALSLPPWIWALGASYGVGAFSCELTNIVRTGRLRRPMTSVPAVLDAQRDDP